jgi:hypothetical protein
MSRTYPLLIAAVGAISMSGCAPTPGADTASSSASNRQCFSPGLNPNFRGNNQTIYMRSRNVDVYELKTVGSCPEVDFGLSIRFKSAGPFSRICTGDTATIEMHQIGQRSLCQVQVVKKLTEAEIAALPSRDRP